MKNKRKKKGTASTNKKKIHTGKHKQGKEKRNGKDKQEKCKLNQVCVLCIGKKIYNKNYTCQSVTLSLFCCAF
jgi:hypothetical protein